MSSRESAVFLDHSKPRNQTKVDPRMSSSPLHVFCSMALLLPRWDAHILFAPLLALLFSSWLFELCSCCASLASGDWGRRGQTDRPRKRSPIFATAGDVAPAKCKMPLLSESSAREGEQIPKAKEESQDPGGGRELADRLEGKNAKGESPVKLLHEPPPQYSSECIKCLCRLTGVPRSPNLMLTCAPTSSTDALQVEQLCGAEEEDPRGTCEHDAAVTCAFAKNNSLLNEHTRERSSTRILRKM
ncbi:hypothetical protein AXG93_136s1240 [Marchantia polymorpha subsp. ruderalis]|uniref:Uncharacterized protein n=1 Tax=Marchantia polymorpha subsp. ruderalis TaxID=1480154 RepID=A0A176W528_MARPO|nr:hypothetical protein AXG93_136s1240 [Marchantia polymorpha subsp. ruderalis]